MSQTKQAVAALIERARHEQRTIRLMDFEELAPAHGLTVSELHEAWMAHHADATAYNMAKITHAPQSHLEPPRARYSLDGREVEIGEIEFEMGAGAHALEATWIDTGSELTEHELEQLNDSCQEALYDDGYQNAVAQAEDWADSREDR